MKINILIIIAIKFYIFKSNSVINDILKVIQLIKKDEDNDLSKYVPPNNLCLSVYILLFDLKRNFCQIDFIIFAL